MDPQSAELPSNQNKVAAMNEKYISKFFKTKITPRFKIGDTVRIRKEKDVFFKGYKARFKEEIFKYVFHCLIL